MRKVFKKRALIFLFILSLLPSFLLVSRIGGGDILFEPKKAGKVVFSHELHIADVGFSCTDCHTKIYINRAKDRSYSMKEMYDGKSCGACHNGKEAFSLKENCVKCHKK